MCSCTSARLSYRIRHYNVVLQNDTPLLVSNVCFGGAWKNRCLKKTNAGDFEGLLVTLSTSLALALTFRVSFATEIHNKIGDHVAKHGLDLYGIFDLI